MIAQSLWKQSKTKQKNKNLKFLFQKYASVAELTYLGGVSCVMRILQISFQVEYNVY